MGNNSNATTLNTGTTESEPGTFITKAGNEIPSDGHSQEWMENLQSKIVDWVETGRGSPSVNMDDDEVEYISNHMQDSKGDPDVPSGFLTRAEMGRHFLRYLSEGLKVGDKLPSNSALRAYGRTQEATYKYCRGWSGTVVIYRTNNNVKHYNATKVHDVYSVEEESFVRQDNLRVDKITRYNGKDYDDPVEFNRAIRKELGIDSGGFNADEVIMVDVSPYEE